MIEQDFNEGQLEGAKARIAKNPAAASEAFAMCQRLVAKCRTGENWQAVDGQITTLRQKLKSLHPAEQLLVIESAIADFEKLADDVEAEALRQKASRVDPGAGARMGDYLAAGRANRAKGVTSAIKLMRTRLDAAECASCSANSEADFRSALQDAGDAIRSFASTLSLEAKFSVEREDARRVSLAA